MELLFHSTFNGVIVMEGYQATFSSLYGTNQTLNGSFDGGNTTCGTGNGADSNTIIVSITSTLLCSHTNS